MVMYVSLISLLLGVLSVLVAVEKEFPTYSQASGTRPNPEGIGNNCVAMGMDLDVSTQQCVPPLGAEPTPIPTPTLIPTPTTNQQNIPSQDLNDGGGASLPNGLSPATSIQTENSTDQLGQAASNDSVGWQTYQDSQHGYKIQYPPEWTTDEPASPLALTQTGFTVTPDDESTGIMETTLVSVNVQDVSRTLDPTTLQVQSIPLEQHANELIQGMSSLKGTPDVLKNEAITFSGEPAWRVDYISNYLGYQTNYGSNIFVFKDDKLYDIGFITAPLKVPEMRPIGEKIIQSFEFTNSTGP